MSAHHLRMVCNPTGAELEAVLDCEEAVFLEEYGNTRTQLQDEYGPYSAATTHIGILNEGGTALAQLRLIADGDAGIKTLNDCSRTPWHTDGYRSARAAGVDIERAWDIGTIGVRKEARRNLGLQLSLALFHGMNLAVAEHGKTHVLAVFDERVRRGLALAGILMNTLPGTFPGEYLGSAASTPVWASTEGLLRRQKIENEQAWQLVAHGVGLEAIEMPAADRFTTT